MKTFYIENLGCAKNQVDAEVMLASLEETGEWESAQEAEAADLIIINTCGFIEPAREESLGTLFEMRNLYPDKKIVLAGCLSQRYGPEISGELPEADGLFGNLNLHEITTLAGEVMNGEHAELYPELPEREYFTRSQLFSFPGSAYLKISEGCSHHCRYCAIPLIRGELRSRPFEDTLADAKKLIFSGVREINLIAQDLAAYGKDRRQAEFLNLLRSISDLPGDFRIRMLYIHPDDFPKDLPALVKERDNIVPYFDIPFQHASSPILRGMGRKGSAGQYLSLLSEIREELPEAVFRSTFMLGFPGERRSSISELERFIEEAQLDWAGFFVYSPEEGTPAFDLRKLTSHKRAAERVAPIRDEMQSLQSSITEARLKRFVGRKYDVLIEEKIEGEDLLIGRIFAQAPEVDGSTVVLSSEGKPGDLIHCGIRRRVGIDLEAVPAVS